VSPPVRADLPGSDQGELQGWLISPIICLITDRTLAPDGDLVGAVAEAVAGGITMVQLREKDLPTRELVDLAVRLRAVVEPPAILLVNGRADIAHAVGADGVHLPSDGLPSDGARAALGASAVIGRSVHSATEALATADEPLSYVELGTIFPSRSHPGGAVVGTREIETAYNCGHPLLAVGGITHQNAGTVIQAGADGVAVISAILAAPNPREAARRLAGAVADAWEHRPRRDRRASD
jgi:thiamine-phosphate pyrophosphorylase